LHIVQFHSSVGKVVPVASTEKKKTKNVGIEEKEKN
jgi:hypothetical protein